MAIARKKNPSLIVTPSDLIGEDVAMVNMDYRQFAFYGQGMAMARIG
jgi:hypothetical protein